MQVAEEDVGLQPPPTLGPEVPPYVNLGLAAAYTTLYSMIFAFVYAQLWLVLRYGHKRLSCQTAFLLLCLLWTALRAVLFSFYFRSPAAADMLGPFTFWLLYCFPLYLQFFILSLLNLYFAQEVFKAKSKYVPELLTYRLPLYLAFLLASLLFLVVNLSCALLTKMTDTDPKIVASVRVAVNDTLFVLCAIFLSLCLCKLSKMSLANIYLESKGTSVCQVTIMAVTIIILYTSRSCYNLVVLILTNIESIDSFDYSWYNITEETELQGTLGDGGYIAFGVILLVWDLLPVSMMVVFFRVRRPAQDRSGLGLPGHGFTSRAYFFDNPRRYDSDDNLAWNGFPQNVQASSIAGSYDWGGRNSRFYIGTEGQQSSTEQGALDAY